MERNRPLPLTQRSETLTWIQWQQLLPPAAAALLGQANITRVRSPLLALARTAPHPSPFPRRGSCCGVSAGPRARRISRGAALLRAHQPPRAGSVARPQLRLGASAGPRAQVHQLGRGPGEGVAARAWGTAPAPTPDTSGRHSSAPTTTTLPSPTECPLNRSTPYASYPPTGILTIGIPCAPSPPPRPAASLQCRRSGPSSPPRVGGTQLKTPMGWAGSMGK